MLSDLVDHLRYHTSLTGAEPELAICLSARASNADYIWNGHVRLGLQAGVREEALYAVDTHGPLDGLTADEALIICFGRELLESPKVSDDTFNAVRARYGAKGLLELTAVMSVYTMNAAILRVMDHQAAADARPLTPRSGPTMSKGSSRDEVGPHGAGHAALLEASRLFRRTRHTERPRPQDSGLVSASSRIGSKYWLRRGAGGGQAALGFGQQAERGE